MANESNGKQVNSIKQQIIKLKILCFGTVIGVFLVLGGLTIVLDKHRNSFVIHPADFF